MRPANQAFPYARRRPRGVDKSFVTSQIDAIRSGKAGRPSGKPEPTVPRIVRHVGDKAIAGGTTIKRDTAPLPTVRSVGSAARHTGRGLGYKVIAKVGRRGKR